MIIRESKAIEQTNKGDLNLYNISKLDSLLNLYYTIL